METDKDLVERARSDPSAFGVLFDEYHPKILSYCLKRTASPSAAQDIAAEVFCKALKNLWRFRWRGVPFSAWLYRIATNEINQYYRSHKKYRTASLDELVEESGFEPPDPQTLLLELEEAERNIERQQQFLSIQKKMAELPLRYQEVIALRFFEDKKIVEIAMILGKKEGTVKSLLSRGMEQLRMAVVVQPSDPHRVVGNEGSNISLPIAQKP